MVMAACLCCHLRSQLHHMRVVACTRLPYALTAPVRSTPVGNIQIRLLVGQKRLSWGLAASEPVQRQRGRPYVSVVSRSASQLASQSVQEEEGDDLLHLLGFLAGLQQQPAVVEGEADHLLHLSHNLPVAHPAPTTTSCQSRRRQITARLMAGSPALQPATWPHPDLAGGRNCCQYVAAMEQGASCSYRAATMQLPCSCSEDCLHRPAPAFRGSSVEAPSHRCVAVAHKSIRLAFDKPTSASQCAG
jgi:hypothetical protein